MRSPRFIQLAILVSLAACPASAQPPKLGYAFPPAVRAGQATEVQLGGYDFTSDLQWFVHDDHLAPSQRIKFKTLGAPGEYHLTPPPYWIGPRTMSTPLPIPREAPARFDVPADAPAGLVRWQVANANGSSATAVILVSRANEIIESRSRDLPQRLPALPVAVSGRLSRLTEVDRYEVVAEKDGLISIDLMARRLGSNFNGVLQVRGPGGELLADLADTQGHDGGVTFAAKAGAMYAISLHDADFVGDRAFVYRLAVTPGPRVVCTIPAFGQRGAAREVEFIGYGVATGKPVLESVRQSVTFPADAALVAHTHALQTAHGSVDVTVPLSDLAEIAREGATDATPLTPPTALTSVLPREAQEHRFTFNAAKGSHWSIDLQSRGLGGRLDVTLAVLGPDGKTVAESDDLPGTTDAALELKPAADGVHTCIVRAVSARTGSLDETYRLAIRPAAPDFGLTIPQQISLPLAGKVEVTVTAARLGGFDKEIAIHVDGLPEGVTLSDPAKPPADAKPVVIAAGKNDVKLTLFCAANAAVVACPIRIRGEATIGEAAVTRDAIALAAGNLASSNPAEQKIRGALLAITMAAPFEVLIVDRERQREVNRGTTYLADVELTRKEGFTGEIRLEMTAAQARYRAGMRGPIVTVAGSETRAQYPIFLPEWLPTDVTQRMNIHGVAVVADPKGTPRSVSKAADARITMIMEGALLKLGAAVTHAAAKPGASFEIPLHVSRSTKLPLPVKIELVAPDELKGLLKIEPLELPAEADRGTLRVTSTSDPRLTGTWPLTITATALQDGKWPVVSQVELPVEFQAGR